jgi:hypothetical protein
VITDNDMPGWLTVHNFWWCVLVLSAIAAVCGLALYAGRERDEPTDWDAPATDLNDVDDTEAQHWNHDRPAPVIWSNHGRPGGWICAAPRLDMPGEICGWPQTHDPCPSHGPLLVPDGWTGGTQ